MTERFLKSLLEVSVSVSAVALLLMLLEPVLRKRFAAKWRRLVWLVLAVRLLVPVNLHFPQPPVRVTVPSAAAGTVVPASPVSAPRASAHAAVSPSPAAPSGTADPERILFAVWLSGSVLFLAWRFAAYFVFLRKIRKTGAEDHGFLTREALLSASEGLRAGGRVPVVRCRALSSPMTAGFFRPAILLPTTNYTGEELEMIFRHELTHIFRRDVWFKLLLSCANAAHWFNPAVWLMARKAGEDAELAYDSAVVDGMDEEFRRRYGRTILSAVRKGRIPTAFSTGFGGGAKSMKRRIRNILDMGKKHRGAAALCAVLLAAAVLGASCAFGADGGAAGKKPAAPSSDASSVEFHSVDTSGFENTTVGAVMPEIDYASPSRIIFHSWFGLFVCDRQNKKVASSVNLQELGYGNMQGSPCTEVFVSGDGKTVCLHNFGGEDEGEMLRYDADANTMEKTAFRKPPDAYVTRDCSENPLPGWTGAAGATYGVMEASGESERRVYIVTEGEHIGDLEFACYDAEPGQTCVVLEINRIFPGTGSEDAPSDEVPQLVQVSDYSLNSIPSDWKVEILPDGESLSFQKDSKQIGSFCVLNYDPGLPISQFEGNHAETLSTKKLGDLSYPAEEAVIRRTQPAAAGDPSHVDELHIYLLPEGKKTAYDLSFDSASVGEDTALRIAETFGLVGARISETVDEGLMPSLKNIEVTNEFISEDFHVTAVLGSLKSDPGQGAAVVFDDTKGGEELARYLTPEKHGAVRAVLGSLGAKADVCTVRAADGYEWVFNALNGFDGGHAAETGKASDTGEGPGYLKVQS